MNSLSRQTSDESISHSTLSIPEIPHLFESTTDDLYMFEQPMLSPNHTQEQHRKVYSGYNLIMPLLFANEPSTVAHSKTEQKSDKPSTVTAKQTKKNKKNKKSRNKREPPNNVIQSRIFLKFNDSVMDKEIRLSHAVRKTRKFTEIAFMIENLGENEIKNVALKWYKHYGNATQIALCERVEPFGYERVVFTFFEDIDGQSYKNETMRMRLTYVGYDEWEQRSIVRRRSKKWNLSLTDNRS